MRARRCRAKLKPTNDSWRVDETYIKVKGEWLYLYRAVDSDGNTVEFMLSSRRNAVCVAPSVSSVKPCVPGIPSHLA